MFDLYSGMRLTHSIRNDLHSTLVESIFAMFGGLVYSSIILLLFVIIEFRIGVLMVLWTPLSDFSITTYLQMVNFKIPDE